MGSCSPNYPNWLRYALDAEEGAVGVTYAFRLAIRALRRFRPEFVWCVFTKKSGSSRNSIVEFGDLTLELENLFQAELRSPFTDSQRNMVNNADCVILGFHRETSTLAAFCSGNVYRPSATAKVQQRITHVGMLIVDSRHQAKVIAPLSGVCLILFGHSLLDLFAQDTIVARINNRHAERIFRRGEPLYRSDHIRLEQDPRVDVVAEAMDWVHTHIYGEKGSLPFGEPIPILHEFPESVTMDGLKKNEIVYVGRRSSLAWFIYRLFTKK